MMPYSLVFIENRTRSEMKPLQCDNPKSQYGLEDRSIKRKGERWAKILTERFDGLECHVEHYDA